MRSLLASLALSLAAVSALPAQGRRVAGPQGHPVRSAQGRLTH